MELDDISEGKPKADIGMKHEDKVWLAPQDLVTKVVQSTSRAHRLVFPEVPDWDPELGLCVVDKSMEEGGIKESNKNDFTQSRDLTTRLWMKNELKSWKVIQKIISLVQGL